MLSDLAKLVVDVNTVSAVFLGKIDYTRAKPHFLIAFKAKDGSVTGAYVEKPTPDQLHTVHKALSMRFAPDVWTNVGMLGFIAARPNEN